MGDRIQLGDRIEGTVIEVNWRSIRVLTDDNDVATIPNSVVARAEILNRSSPTPQRAAKIEIGCIATAAPNRVIELLAQAALMRPGILAQPAPTGSLIRLGQRTDGYMLSFTVAGTAGLAATKSLLLREIRRNLHHAGLLGAHDIAPRPLAPRALLRELMLFEALDDVQIDALTAQLQHGSFAPDAVIFAQGKGEAILYVVAGGIVEITRAADNRPAVPVGRIGPGEYFGEIGLLTGAPRAVSAVALTACDILELDRGALAPLLKASPGLAEAFDLSVRRGMARLQRDIAA